MSFSLLKLSNLFERNIVSQWAMGNGQWAKGNERWAMGNERWAMRKGHWTMLLSLHMLSNLCVYKQFLTLHATNSFGLNFRL